MSDENRNPFLELNNRRIQSNINGDNMWTMLMFILNIVEIIFILLCYSENSQNHKQTFPIDNCVYTETTQFNNLTSNADQCMNKFYDLSKNTVTGDYCISWRDLQDCFKPVYELINHNIVNYAVEKSLKMC